MRIGRYELRENVCGAGQWRGGLGSIREFTFLADGGASIEGEGHRFPPWGFNGGNDGEPAALQRVGADREVDALPSKVPYTEARAGDSFVCVGPAGGGYGDPLKRDPARVLDDVLDGIISRDAAARDYGVVITATDVVDGEATSARRG